MEKEKEIKNFSSEIKKHKEIVSKEKLLEAGVYFGHNKSIWNPKMKPYILMTKKGTHIIDIQKTKKTLKFAYQIIKKFAERGANFIFVGTRKQAKKTIEFNALRTNSLYVSERWLGGTLTNNRTIFARVRRMFDLEKLVDNNFKGYTKKEGVLLKKEYEKLKKNLSGIKNMRSKPNVMIISDPKTDEIAIKEAKKLGIKIISIVDTNIDPSTIDIAIPANDDSIKSISLIITILADAIASVKGGQVLFAYQDDSKIKLPEEQKSEKPFRKRYGLRTHYRKPIDWRKENKKTFNQDEKNNVKEIKSTQNERSKEVQKESILTSIKIDLSKFTFIKLKEIAKEKEVKGYSKMKKDELIKVLS